MGSSVSEDEEEQGNKSSVGVGKADSEGAAPSRTSRSSRSATTVAASDSTKD